MGTIFQRTMKRLSRRRRRAASRPALGLLLAAMVIAVSAGAAGAEAGTSPDEDPRLVPEAWSPLDTIFTLPPVEVEADRLRRFERGERAALVSDVIRPASHPRRNATVGELLAELPGVELRSLGGVGSFSTASIRGSGQQEVAVFLDGVDLRSPFSGLALLDELPLAGVERLEIYRGGVPGELGGGAAGAVNVVTGDGGRMRLRLGGGSFGTRWAGLSSGGSGPWGLDWFLAAGALRTESDYLYLDRNGTTVSNAADDTLRVRRNADVDARDILARLRWQPAGGRLGGRWELFYRYLSRENGVPGTESLPTESTRSLRSGHDTRLGWRSPLLPGSVVLRADAYARDGWTRFLNPEGETGSFLVSDETRDHLVTLGLQGRADLYLPPFHLLLRAERRKDRFLPENLNPLKGKGFERQRSGRRHEAEARLLLADDTLLLTAAYGEERLADNFHGPPPLPWLPPVPQPEHVTRARSRRAGMRLRLLKSERGFVAGELLLRANAGDSYRPPTLLELFGQDVSVTPNLELRPESGVERDIGLAWRGALGALGVEVNLNAFHRELEDQILFLHNSQYSVRAENLSASRITGREFSLRLAWRRWSLALADTRLDARDRGGDPNYDGKELPFRTPRSRFLRLSRGWKGLALDLELDHRSATHYDRYNDPDHRQPAATLYSASLSWRLPRSLRLSNTRLTIEGRNLGDAHVGDRLGYPLPGRHWTLGLEWAGRATHQEG